MVLGWRAYGAGDWIWLLGVECRARVGVPYWERKKPQKILVDVGMRLDLSRAASTDDVKHTADYWAIEQAVRARVSTGAYKLLERLAAELAQVVLAQDRRIRAVTLRAHKTPAVMPKTREVVVEVVRRRR